MGVVYNFPEFSEMDFIKRIFDMINENDSTNKDMSSNPLYLNNIGLKLDKQHKNLFKIFREFVFHHTEDMTACVYLIFASENLINEIGERMGLSSIEVRFLVPDEINEFLSKNIDKKRIKNIVKNRMELCVVYFYKDNCKILDSSDAENFLENIFHEKEIEQNLEYIWKEEKDKKLINGFVAYPGIVKGEVCILKGVDDIEKIKKGQILVASLTVPQLLPAMKKSAAIITDTGGITSHAAIVARELKKPCIVGTGNATKLLKDGDLVEVDADNGVVRILERVGENQNV